MRVSLLNAVVALSVMFVLHAATGWMHHIQVVHDLIQNQPVMLAAHGHILDEALRRTGTSRSEVHQAMRLKGFGSLDEVAAVVLERNGQFSVVSRSQRLDDGVLRGDRRRAAMTLLCSGASGPMRRDAA